MKLFTVFFTLLFLTLQCHAEIYEIIDKNGRKTFTDKPPANQLNAKPITPKTNIGNTWQKTDTHQENQNFFNDLKNKQTQTEETEQAENYAQISKEKQQQINIEAAENALRQAQEVKGGDFFNNKEGGMHYSPQYLLRVEEAQRNLERAKSAQ